MSDPDTIRIAQANMPMTRGLAPAINAPIYMTRGGILNDGGTPSSHTINANGINEDPSGAPVTGLTYSDLVNLNAPKTRGSAKISVDAILGADINPPA
jgi:hypothetical protein